MQYVKIDKDLAVLAVNGFFNFSRCKAVRAEISTAFQTGCTRVLIDFGQTTFIDSAAIRMLCDIRDQVHPENFSARNATGKTLTQLKSGNLDSWLKN